MSDFLLSLITIKELLVRYCYLIIVLGGGLLYYSYRKALSILLYVGTLILGVGLGSLLFRLIAFLSTL